jgi:hypothetical protein
LIIDSLLIVECAIVDLLVIVDRVAQVGLVNRKINQQSTFANQQRFTIQRSLITNVLVCPHRPEA